MSQGAFQVYTQDEQFNQQYLAYQSKYAEKMREGDKVLINKIQSIVEQRGGVEGIRLLDVGCSTGNLLLHIQRLVPGLALVGLDLSKDAVEMCQANPQLQGINFVVGSAMSMENLFEQPFDIVIANAMVHPLTYEEFEQALVQFGRVLKPNGYHLNFDGFHPFEQEIAVMEYSTYGSSLGIPIYYRSFTRTSQLLERAGFDRIEFHPFEMPFDLERDPQDFTNLTTYTVRTEDGKRMSMRGSIYQSWCHLYAQKRSE